MGQRCPGSALDRSAAGSLTAFLRRRPETARDEPLQLGYPRAFLAPCPVPLLADYLRALALKRASGQATNETTYYGPLEALLDEAGSLLKPRVHAVGQLRDAGFGRPDFGLFTSGQLGHLSSARGPKPLRGVVEAKGVGVHLDQMLDPTSAEGQQVAKYRAGYGAVLVTNFRGFALVGTGTDGAAEVRERFDLATTEEAFWQMTLRPDQAEAEVGLEFAEFVRRALRHNAPITEPRDLSEWLASYARDARRALERADIHRLDALRLSLESSLGVTFSDERGQRFFVATVVQTLFYGLFSAWTLWLRDDDTNPARQNFWWRRAGDFLRVPALQALFDEVTKSSNVRALGLDEHLNRATALLNRVEHRELFPRFEDEAAITLFYEPFLEAYDPVLREEYGVWYTPRPLVKYMVERVDTVLREDLGRPLGLADPGVVVVDPACGTGAYLLACLDRIEQTLKDQKESMVEAKLRTAATERLIGFEILTAPFVVAHLQIGLYLREKRVPLGEEQRAAVFLTNALTGWDDGPHPTLPIPELAAERDAAERIKQHAEVLVVLGNPPYEALADVPVGEERALREAYVTTKRAPAPVGRATNDLFVRFFRVAERAIVERPPEHGVVCLVTKSVWLDGMGHVGMRERFLDVFSRIWIDNLNGDSRETGKRTPEGKPDPSVFSLGANRSPIKSGVAVATLVRKPERPAEGDAEVVYRDLWGKTKLVELAATSDLTGTSGYRRVATQARLGFPFAPRSVRDGYFTWPSLTELFPFSSPGVITARADLVEDIDQGALRDRIGKYFDPAVPFEALRDLTPAAVRSTKRFDARDVRTKLSRRGLSPGEFVRFLYRPFDSRWLFWEPDTKLIEEKRPQLRAQWFDGNVMLTAAARERKGYSPPVVTTALGSFHTVESGASYFPLKVKPGTLPSDLFDESGDASDSVPNLSREAVAYLKQVGMVDDPEVLFYHSLAVLHAPAYQTESSGALRQDWPRVPLPEDPEDLEWSARLGRRLAALLDVDRPVVDLLDECPPLRAVAVPTREDLGPFDTHAGDGYVDAKWGRRQDGAVYSGAGRFVRREFASYEIDVQALFGGRTVDVFLNARSYWSNVPEPAWLFRLGGYPVLRKWLSYRETSVLGRHLTDGEVLHFQDAARRICALLLMHADLDSSYHRVADTVGVMSAG